MNADMATWYWHPYVDPNFNLSVVTKAQWGNYSDTGFDDPKYDAWWSQQAKMIDQKQRQALVWKMEAYLAAPAPLHPARAGCRDHGLGPALHRLRAAAVGLLQVLLHEPAADLM